MTLGLAPRTSQVGPLAVARYLPNRARRTVGAWCFLDHYGGPDGPPAAPDAMVVPPHPHLGLQTVTWLFEGAVRHLDSLGSDQHIRPGELNVMTAGHGVAHAELGVGHPPAALHGVQLWVALPEAARAVAPSFEHHDRLPRVDLGNLQVRVFAGALAGARSPAGVHSPLVGAELDLGAGPDVELAVEPAFEHALLAVTGDLGVDGRPLRAGACVYLAPGRRALHVSAPTGGGRALLLGGEPYAERLAMWWNFVGHDLAELAAARADWEGGRRFGSVAPDGGPRVAAPPLRRGASEHQDHGG